MMPFIIGLTSTLHRNLEAVPLKIWTTNSIDVIVTRYPEPHLPTLAQAMDPVKVSSSCTPINRYGEEGDYFA